jgi:ubiquinone/menaquinone biosynthesis C-methylase UbiE
VLQRVLEPEVMDTEADAVDYDAIDNTAVNELFASRAHELSPSSGRVLDLGCGPGHIAVLLAHRAPSLKIVACDLAEHMLILARRRVAQAGLEGRIDILTADAKDTGLPDHSFDMVISNSLVHHIPEPEEMFREVKRVSRPRAALFLKDLLRPDSLAEWQHLVNTYASGADCSPNQRRLFADSLRAALSLREVTQLCKDAGLVDAIVQQVSDRHWVVERAAKD